jgi:UDP-N-acetylmuramoylalanine--D-glutamate ligase
VELRGKRVVVVGLARSGIAAVRFLAAQGAEVVATDRKPAAELGASAAALAGPGVRLELGGHRRESFASADLVVTSPGVPWEADELLFARARGVPVIAEIELGCRALRGTLAAVTGTKGKTTTTAALGAMLRAGGAADVRVGGNIGAPLTGLLDGAGDDTRFVLEVSSFQLEGTESLKPHVAVFTNLSPDHLDRHPSFEAYAAAKARIFQNQGPEDWAVVNADDPEVTRLLGRGRARLLPFSASPGKALADDAAFFDEGAAWLRRDGQREQLFPLASVRLPGRHLAMDLMAAGAAACLLGVPAEAVARAVLAFEGVEHVLERVAELDGVAFFNDSKATNVAAVRVSLEALERPVVAIMGGRYKGGDFAELREAAAKSARAVVTIGESRGLIGAALAGSVPVHPAASLREAVATAFGLARPGDAVLLAPGCSSFDMFTDYAARGRAFKEEVRALSAQGAEAVRG